MPTKQLIPTHDLDQGFFLINRIESANANRFMGHHRHVFYEMLWFTSDGDDHLIDFEPYPVRKNLVYFLSPGQVHAVLGQRPTGFAVVCTTDFFNNIPEEYLKQLFTHFINEGIMLREADLPQLHTLVNLLEVEHAGQQNPLIIQSYLKALLFHIYRASQGAPAVASFRDPRLNTLLHLIQTHYKTERKAEFYAEHLGLTTQRVNELLKEKRGFTVTQAIHDQLVLEAKRRISDGEQTFKEIAFELGFNEQGYFSRFFKKQTGSTPKEFREKLAPMISTSPGSM
ncbi:AraC family transcriptional regulator [Hymenobacter sp.]|jgi:AraC-like DNA-binding protein|uniref:helix-turn-helix domain-containing protein n=1 Tax=Hymenobacter sp. TaxID=1898978 RepID=UPI002ED81F3C